MSRTKKSRKPGAGSASVPKAKESKAELAQAAPRRAKKANGKPAGNRQQEAKVTKNSQADLKNKDPRIGNKTPIVLGAKKTTEPVQKAKAIQESPIAAIRAVEAMNDPAQEIAAIENDPKLLAIVDKQDENAALTAEEVDYYNTQMERHQLLSEELDEDDESELISEAPSLPADEDELWDKFDNSDLSKFE